MHTIFPAVAFKTQFTGAAEVGGQCTTRTHQQGNHLLAIQLVGNRWCRDAEAHVIGPKLVTGAGIVGFQHAIRLALENQVAGCGQGSATPRAFLVNLPHTLVPDRVPGLQGTA